MKILSITAQKPNSTGSGVYLTELVKEFAGLGHEQAVIAGIYQEDTVEFPEGVKLYPVYFKTEELPFPIAGMSDEMPYESTVYGQMTPEMTEAFVGAFRRVIRKAAEEFRPDLVICHHLYLVTALAREELEGYRVFGFCHNTDLRQMQKTDFQRKYIRSQIPKLDAVFAIHEEQKEEICQIYDMSGEKIFTVGTGYNHHLFRMAKENEAAEEENQNLAEKKKLRLIFAGKLSEKKGVMSLLRSLSYLPWKPDEAELVLAGGYGNEEEYAQIRRLAEEASYPVRFAGRISQEELAEEYRNSDIFVLPSFFDGMPLTMIEAMACGDRVVMTALPGIPSWVDAHVPDAPIVYVQPPEMYNTDEPVPESLPGFERELAEKIQECAQMRVTGSPDLRQISWGNICRIVLRENDRCQNQMETEKKN